METNTKMLIVEGIKNGSKKMLSLVTHLTEKGYVFRLEENTYMQGNPKTVAAAPEESPAPKGSPAASKGSSGSTTVKVEVVTLEEDEMVPAKPAPVKPEEPAPEEPAPEEPAPVDFAPLSPDMATLAAFLAGMERQPMEDRQHSQGPIRSRGEKRVCLACNKPIAKSHAQTHVIKQHMKDSAIFECEICKEQRTMGAMKDHFQIIHPGEAKQIKKTASAATLIAQKFRECFPN